MSKKGKNKVILFSGLLAATFGIGGWAYYQTSGSNVQSEVQSTTTVPDTTTLAEGQELPTETAEPNPQDSTNNDDDFWEDLVEEAGEGELNTEQILAENEKLKKLHENLNNALETKEKDIAQKKQILLTENAVGVKLDEMIIEENKKQEQKDKIIEQKTEQINALTYLKKLLDEGTLYDEAMKQTQKKYPKVDIVELRKQE